MKFTTHAGDLADALSLAGRVIPRTPSLSVFSGVHLVVKGDQLAVTGSDEGETTVTVTLEVTDAQAGTAVLHPKPLGSFLQTISAKTVVTVSSDDQTKVTVHAAGGNPYTFRAMDQTFPATATGKPEKRLVDLAQLSAAVAAVRDCARKSKVVQLVSDETGLRLHATDGLRLARAHLSAAGFGPFSGLVPLGVLEQIAESPITEMQIHPRGRILGAAGDRVSIVARLIDEMFPAVDTVLSSTPAHHVTVPTAALKGALARLSSVAEEKQAVTVSVSGDEVVLSMESVNVGSGVERIELDVPSDVEVTFGVNMDFLAAAVATHTGGSVVLGWTAPVQPIFLTSTSPIGVTSVIMPVKLA